ISARRRGRCKNTVTAILIITFDKSRPEPGVVQIGTLTPRLKAIVFDFDGTLVDSYQAITDSVNHVRAGHQLPPLTEPEVRRHVGRGPVYLLERTVPGVDLEADLARYRAHHPSVLRSGRRLWPGVQETLQALAASGLRLAVCSNKPGPLTRQLLECLGLARLFRAAIGPEDAPRLKPAPDMLQAALRSLQVDRS